MGALRIVRDLLFGRSKSLRAMREARDEIRRAGERIELVDAVITRTPMPAFQRPRPAEDPMRIYLDAMMAQPLGPTPARAKTRGDDDDHH